MKLSCVLLRGRVGSIWVFVFFQKKRKPKTFYEVKNFSEPHKKPFEKIIEMYSRTEDTK